MLINPVQQLDVLVSFTMTSLLCSPISLFLPKKSTSNIRKSNLYKPINAATRIYSNVLFN